MWYTRSQGNDGIISWERIQEQKVIESTAHRFKLGPFDIAVPAENFVVFEYFQGSDLSHNFQASTLFLGILVFSVMVLLTVITTMEGFWYFGGMSLFIIFMVAMRLEVLMLGGSDSMLIPGAIILVYVSVSYFFKSIRPDTTFSSRLLTFLLISAAVWIAIKTLSTVTSPVLHLTLTAYVPALILSILFIIMVAHEIGVAFVSIASQGRSESLWHYFIISILYLTYLMITALHEMGTIQWNLLYMDVYLLLSISAILGLWGFRLRQNLYENIFSFAPFGAFFFLALASIAFITIAQLFGNGNDAALRVIRDFIIFSHTGFGIAFLLYMASNFMPLMAENLPVYPVLYKPTRMPHFSFRLAGIVATSVFLFLSFWRDYVYHSKAGFYNYAADLQLIQGNEDYGRVLFERSRINAFQNHRANYALAMIKSSRLDFDRAAENFQLANGKRPSSYSLVNEGVIRLWRKQYFPAIEVYQNARKKSNSKTLDVNLGFAYAKVHNLDSALYFLSEAREDDFTRPSAETNFFAVIASEYIPVDADSILRSFNSEGIAVSANALAASTIFGQDFKSSVDPLANRELDLFSATLLNNYIVHNITELDTAFTRKALSLATDSLNATFSEPIKASLAMAFYHQGNVQKAQEILAELVFLSQENRGKYNYLLGLWAMEQETPLMAHDYFAHAVATRYKKAPFYDAIALSEAMLVPQARVAWDSLALYGDEGEQQIAKNMQGIFRMTPTEALNTPDASKYQYLRYRLSYRDTLIFNKIANTFENENYRAQAMLDMAKKLYSADEITGAIRLYRQVAGAKLNNKQLYDEIRHFELRMLASRNEVKQLADQINNNIEFSKKQNLEKLLYTALLNEFSGDTENATKNFTILGKWNPFFEDGIIAAANYFRKLNPESATSYNILAEAIQINAKSIRLLKAYAAEASRQGMDDYAASAIERIEALK